jgi:hypothetical protein
VKQIFTCKKFQLSPTLSFLGESTPSLEKVFRWLGVNNMDHAIPKATHRGITITGEKILQLLWDISLWMEKMDSKL